MESNSYSDLLRKASVPRATGHAFILIDGRKTVENIRVI